ncbi:MAG: hypothetical protein J6V08_03330, partial [Candidatus Methanomethylophilaceae archaeon]|nr:hypothetical protein [Candidatus Methanomethylophilaceae archaeon]
MEEVYNSIVMVFDDDFLTPACTTIASILDNKRRSDKYRIYVCTPGLSENSLARLNHFIESSSDVSIIIKKLSTGRYN